MLFQKPDGVRLSNNTTKIGENRKKVEFSSTVHLFTIETVRGIFDEGIDDRCTLPCTVI